MGAFIYRFETATECLRHMPEQQKKMTRRNASLEGKFIKAVIIMNRWNFTLCGCHSCKRRSRSLTAMLLGISLIFFFLVSFFSLFFCSLKVCCSIIRIREELRNLTSLAERNNKISDFHHLYTSDDEKVRKKTIFFHQIRRMLFNS